MLQLTVPFDLASPPARLKFQRGLSRTAHVETQERQRGSVPKVVAFCRNVFRTRGRSGRVCGPSPRHTDEQVRPPDTVDLLEVAKGLAGEFERRQMHSHLQCLKQFAAAHRRPRAVEQGAWSTEMVLTWAALLRVPPMQRLYPVHPHAVVCPGCNAVKAIMRVEISWIGGSLIRCDGCGFQWLKAH